MGKLNSVHGFIKESTESGYISVKVLLNPYWQITETKSKNRVIAQRHSRKDNPKKFENFLCASLSVIYEKKPDNNPEYLVIILLV